MKIKRNYNRRCFFAVCSPKYNPENTLLWLEATLPDCHQDLIDTIHKDGYLEEHETYRSRYKGSKDMPHLMDYYERKQRDLTFEVEHD